MFKTQAKKKCIKCIKYVIVLSMIALFSNFVIGELGYDNPHLPQLRSATKLATSIINYINISGSMNYTNIALTNQSNTFTKSNLFQDNITISNGEDLFYDGVMVTPKLVISKTSQGIGTCVFHVNVTDNDGIKITDNNLRDFICFCSTSNDAIAKSTCQLGDAGAGVFTGSIVGAASYMGVYGFDSSQQADIRISELPPSDVTRYLVCLGPDGRRFFKDCVVGGDI